MALSGFWSANGNAAGDAGPRTRQTGENAKAVARSPFPRWAAIFLPAAGPGERRLPLAFSSSPR